jgi:excisionase family DNA binding protein
MGDSNLKLSDREVSAIFADASTAEKYPPVMNIEQVAEFLQVPVNTIYQWRSQGRLSTCCRRVGKHLRFYRDRLVKKAFNEGI